MDKKELMEKLRQKAYSDEKLKMDYLANKDTTLWSILIVFMLAIYLFLVREEARHLGSNAIDIAKPCLGIIFAAIMILITYLTSKFLIRRVKESKVEERLKEMIVVMQRNLPETIEEMEKDVLEVKEMLVILKDLE